MLPDDRRVVPLTLLAQAGVGFAAGGVSWLWLGAGVAAAAWLGAAVAVIPNAFLAARLLAPRDASARALLRAAWVGELGKVVLTVVLFGVVFGVVKPAAPLAVFGGFIATQLVVFVVAAIPYGGAGADRELRTRRAG